MLELPNVKQQATFFCCQLAEIKKSANSDLKCLLIRVNLLVFNFANLQIESVLIMKPLA